MRDVIKVFITTQQTDSSHYWLSDLQEPVDWDGVDLGTHGPRRNANLAIRREVPWFTDEKGKYSLVLFQRCGFFNSALLDRK